MPDGGGLTYQASTIMTLTDELRNGPSYALNSDEKLLRQRAADEIERLSRDLADEQHKSRELEKLIQRRASVKVQRRAA